MPVMFLGEPGEVGHNISLEIDRERLIEIRDELENTGDILKIELVDMKRLNKQKVQPGTEIYHKLTAVHKAILSAVEVLDRVTVEE